MNERRKNKCSIANKDTVYDLQLTSDEICLQCVDDLSDDDLIVTTFFLTNCETTEQSKQEHTGELFAVRQVGQVSVVFFFFGNVDQSQNRLPFLFFVCSQGMTEFYFCGVDFCFKKKTALRFTAVMIYARCNF